MLTLSYKNNARRCLRKKRNNSREIWKTDLHGHWRVIKALSETNIVVLCKRFTWKPYGNFQLYCLKHAEKNSNSSPQCLAFVLRDTTSNNKFHSLCGLFIVRSLSFLHRYSTTYTPSGQFRFSNHFISMQIHQLACSWQTVLLLLTLKSFKVHRKYLLFMDGFLW